MKGDTLEAPAYPNFTWTFSRFSDAASRVKEARIWARIHFRNSGNVGGAQGVTLAEYVVNNFLLPLPTGHDDP